jgi:hypothetical protein
VYADAQDNYKMGFNHFLIKEQFNFKGSFEGMGEGND